MPGKKYIKRFIYFLFVLLTFVACNASKRMKNQNVANIYQRNNSVIHPQFVVFHSGDSISELYFKLNSKELLYSRQNNSDLTANVLISCKLIVSFGAKQIIDSASIKLTDINNDGSEKDIIGKMNLKVAYGTNCLLEVNIIDLNRGKSLKSFINVDKTNNLNRQNFIVKQKDKDIPLFRYYLKQGEEVSVFYKNNKIAPLYVNYYKREFPLPAPPFSVSEHVSFQYKADSIFRMAVDDNGRVDFLPLNEGFYHIRVDNNESEGLTLYRFPNDFPEIKLHEQLLYPLRFITTKQEYEDMNLSNDKKEVVDRFWIQIAGSKEKAREMIRIFYNRVQDANGYFTSYMEGWKTDRGMIYLIYGPPNAIYKTTYSENWVYGEENNLMSLTYTFVKVDNPFSDNDYALERNSLYRNSWYMAVDMWRQGRIH